MNHFRFFILYLIPALIVVLGIPLVLQLVPPNGFYGFRTGKSLSSPEIWYKTNQVAGIALVLSGGAGFVVRLLLVRCLTSVSAQNVLIYVIFIDTFILVMAAAAAWLYSNRLL
jgi:uncharacterized membrane protein